MGDETGAGGGGRLTRRSLLAGAGVSVVAGCSSLDGLGGGSDRTIRGFELPDVDPDSVPEPVVAPSVPVEVGPEAFDLRRDRVTGLLEELPTPLGSAAIPNGHVRHHLTDAADTATDGLDGARTARTGMEALQAFRDAREHARYAAAGWGVADRGLSRESLRREYREIVSDGRSFEENYEYVGTDRVRATLVHARIEDWIAGVTDGDRTRIRDDGELLTVAQWGETVESTQAFLDDAEHVAEQYEESLPADAGTVEETLTQAAEALVADAQSRRTDLPPEPTAEEWGLAERVVNDLRREADPESYSIADADGPASAVVDLTGRLAGFRALVDVQKQIDAGEIASAESADDVRAVRTTAYDALDTALSDSPAANLARTVLSRLSFRVSGADRELDRYRGRGDLSPSSLDDVMENYIVTAAVARATPDACRQTIDALKTA